MTLPLDRAGDRRCVKGLLLEFGLWPLLNSKLEGTCHLAAGCRLAAGRRLAVGCCMAAGCRLAAGCPLPKVKYQPLVWEDARTRSWERGQDCARCARMGVGDAGRVAAGRGNGGGGAAATVRRRGANP